MWHKFNLTWVPEETQGNMHWRYNLCLSVIWHRFCSIWYPEEAHANTHWGETLFFSRITYIYTLESNLMLICNVTRVSLNQVSWRAYTNTQWRKKSYSCQQSDNNFTQSGSLKRHMKTHIEEKPYANLYLRNLWLSAMWHKFHLIW